MNIYNLTPQTFLLFLLHKYSPQDFKMDSSGPLETMNVATAQVSHPSDEKPSNENSMHVSDTDFPTEEELATLRRVSGKIPWITFTVAFVELCERFSYYGTTAVCKFARRLSRTATDIL